MIYQCTNCGKQYQASPSLYLCPECSKLNKPNQPAKGVFRVIYDYTQIAKHTTAQKLKNTGYIDILPIKSTSSLPKLRVGNTPLYNFDAIDGAKLPFNLLLKDDSQNPTYSFKDRASAVVSAYAKENGIGTIVAASTGNAGSSLAGICASQRQKAIIFVPKAAPLAKLTQIVMYGAKIIPVDGTYDNAFDLSVEATARFGWYNRNTAYNPLTVEGKKTVAFELYDQMNGQLPDKIFVPVGDGVIISGVYKGFEDLFLLGLIDHLPTIVAVQSAGSNNLIANINTNEFVMKPSTTIADSISVDIPRNFFMAKQFIKQYNGETCEVSDDEITQASAILSRNTGIFAEPAATTAYAGMLAQKNTGKIKPNSKCVVLLTGSGLKDLKSVASLISMPKPIKNIDEININN